jgi:hypothetical protein
LIFRQADAVKECTSSREETKRVAGLQTEMVGEGAKKDGSDCSTCHIKLQTQPIQDIASKTRRENKAQNYQNATL